MAQIVRSSKIDNGSEINVRYTYYITKSENDALDYLLCLLFDCHDQNVDELKIALGEGRQLLLRRLMHSIERSL